MALLVGLLIGLGRLSGDREAVALLACGVSPYRLLRPVLLLATRRRRPRIYVMIWAIPDANQTFRRNHVYDVVAKQVENDVRAAGVLRELPELGALRPRRAPAGGGWKDVLVANTSKPDAPDAPFGRARPARARPREADRWTWS